MANNVQITWQTESQQQAPGSMSQSHYLVTLGAALSANVPLAQKSHTFLAVAPGDYLPGAALIGTDGSTLKQMTGSVVTVLPPVLWDVPTTVIAQVA